MINQSTTTDHREWQEGDLHFTEVIRQEYSNCKFSAGMVEGHPVDTMYLRLKRDGKIDTDLLLRPDEAAALAWCLNGALWTKLIAEPSKKPRNNR